MKDFEIEGKKYKAVLPTAGQRQQAQSMYAKAIAKNLREGAMLESQLRALAEEQGVWTQENEAKIKELQVEFEKLSDQLEKGGIELEEAKKIALKISDLRIEIVQEQQPLHNILSISAEKLAQNVQMDFLLSCCVLNGQGKPFCKNLEDYYKKSEHPVMRQGALEFSKLWYNFDENLLADLPENKFLSDYGFMNENLQFIDESGNLVDKEGNPIEEKEVVEFSPFLKDGKPVSKKEAQDKEAEPIEHNA